MKSNFEQDFQDAIQYFPKLKFTQSENRKMWIVSGELDICDQNGDYWETFIITVYVPTSYPYCVPLVREMGHIIERDNDWHIDNEGFCCLDIEHKLLLYKRRGLNFFDFIKNVVYPYFANQIYKENRGIYAAEEYLHGFDGIMQFYREELNICNSKLAIDILKGILSKELPGRNDPCFCCKTKYKYCHLNSVEFLRSIPEERLIKDLDGFYKLTENGK